MALSGERDWEMIWRSWSSEFTDIDDHMKQKTYHIFGNKKVNRYYSSILESTTQMSADALTLLNREDYVGFLRLVEQPTFKGDHTNKE